MEREIKESKFIEMNFTFTEEDEMPCTWYHIIINPTGWFIFIESNIGYGFGKWEVCRQNFFDYLIDLSKEEFFDGYYSNNNIHRENFIFRVFQTVVKTELKRFRKRGTVEICDDIHNKRALVTINISDDRYVDVMIIDDSYSYVMQNADGTYVYDADGNTYDDIHVEFQDILKDAKEIYKSETF